MRSNIHNHLNNVHAFLIQLIFLIHNYNKQMVCLTMSVELFMFLTRDISSSFIQWETLRKWSLGRYYNNLDPNNVWPTLCLVLVGSTPPGWDRRRNDYLLLFWLFLLHLQLCRHRQTESCNSVRWQGTHITRGGSGKYSVIWVLSVP